MKSREVSNTHCSITEVTGSEDELVEAVTALRQGRGVPNRTEGEGLSKVPRSGRSSRRSSGRSPEPSPESLPTPNGSAHVDKVMDAGILENGALGSMPGEDLPIGAQDNIDQVAEAEVEPLAGVLGDQHPDSNGVPAAHVSSERGVDSSIDPIDSRALVSILEALVFVSHDPLTFERAMAALGVPKAELMQAFRQLQEEYDCEGRGLQVVELAGGFRIVTRPEYAPWLKRLEKTRPAPKLSRSALESLAIIAYKQPVVRAEIEHIRGVETSGVLRTLLERKLVRMVGRKEVPGRPIMYGTTKYFLEHFGLKDLSELPPLREFKELGESDQAFLPVDDELLSVSLADAVGTDLRSSESPEQPESEEIIAADPG